MDSDEGLIDVHFSASFLEYARRPHHAPARDSDLWTLRYSSQPASLVAANPPGTIWATSNGRQIHASFPSASNDRRHNFTATPPPPSATSDSDFVLIFSPTSNSYVLSAPLAPADQVHLKPDRSNKFPATPKVPEAERALGQKTKEFFERDGLNPFDLIRPRTGRDGAGHDADMKDKDDDDDDDDDDEDEDEGEPVLANVPSYLRNPALSASTATQQDAEVEDFGSLSFTSARAADGNGDATMSTTNVAPTASSTPSGSSGLVLPVKKKTIEEEPRRLEQRTAQANPSASVAHASPPTNARTSPPRPDLIRPSEQTLPQLPQLPPLHSQAPRHPQFSSKIPASSTRAAVGAQARKQPAPSHHAAIATTRNPDLAESSDSSSSSDDDDDDDDADFEDVSIPAPPSVHSNALANSSKRSSSTATRTASATGRGGPPVTTSTSRSSDHQRLSTSLRSIIDPPSSPASKPPPPRPSSRAPGTGTIVPGTSESKRAAQKKRKTSHSHLAEDQASSDSSSSSEGGEGGNEDDSEDDLEASINASMSQPSGGNQRVAMSSGGKGRRTLPPPHAQQDHYHHQHAPPGGTAATTRAASSSAPTSSSTKPPNAVPTRPTVSRKGLAPPAIGATTQTTSGGGGMSAYDAQRLAQYGYHHLNHARGYSNGSVGVSGAAGVVSGAGGATASPVMGRVELESSDEDDDSASDSD